VVRLFKPALALVALAAVLHVAATAGTWVARRIELARAQQSLAQLAAQAGIRVGPDADAAAELARAYTGKRHDAGLTAPGDAVPLLARAAPTLAALPDAALRSAAYAGRAWTLELGSVDEATASRVLQAIATEGVPVVHARHANGVRLRVGPLP
jgi:hypothetical protein